MSAQMLLLIVGLMILPQPPQDLQPAVGQLAIGFVFRMAMGAGLLVIGGRPGRTIDRELGPLLDDLAEFMVAGIPKDYIAGLAALLSHWTGARQGLQDGRGGKALPILAKHGQ